MKYMGSKNRIAKHLLPIMLENRNGRTWVEPFVGGANMIDKVEGKRIGADFNKYLIRALNVVKYDFDLIPNNNKEFTEDDFYKIKSKKLNGISDLECFLLHVCSFSGMFNSGFARGRETEDFVRAAKGNAKKQAPLIKGVTLIHSSYDKLEIPPNSLIYCDPPYEGTAKYKTGDFNHLEFWEWCRTKAKEGHQVFISEYNAPKYFRCVWEKELINNLNSKKASEKLFVYCG